MIIIGVDSQYIISLKSSPAGTPVTDQPNTFDYPILSTVTLTCLVTFSNGTPVADTFIRYRWNTTGCYRNNDYDRGTPRCFPHGKTKQIITGGNLTAEDAGTVICTATILDFITIASMPLTLRISGNNY